MKFLPSWTRTSSDPQIGHGASDGNSSTWSKEGLRSALWSLMSRVTSVKEVTMIEPDTSEVTMTELEISEVTMIEPDISE